MAHLLVPVLVSLLLGSASGKIPFHQCCPEDDEHLFLKKEGICNASRTLGLGCQNDTEVTYLLKSYGAYWLRENHGTIVIGSETIGMVLAHDWFCVGTIGYETASVNNTNETQWMFEEGIVHCDEAEFYATYLGPEPLSYAVCILISGIGCFLTFLTYLVVPTLRRDLLSKCLVSALLCLTVTYLTYGITAFQAHRLPHRFCAYQILFMIFWTVASVFWMNTISFDIWRSVVFRRFPLNEAQLLKVYYCWAWGMPLLLTFGALINHFQTREYSATCYVDPVYIFFLFVVPALVLFFFNLLYFIWSMCKLSCQSSPTSPGPVTKLRKLRYLCLLYLKLFLVMGIPWIIRFIAEFFEGNTFYRVMMNMLVILQGLFVFLLLVVFRKKALLGLAAQFANWGCPCPFITTNFAVTLHDENDDDDDDNGEVDRDGVDRDIVELNTQTTITS